MDLCRSRRKENRRIEISAEGSAFVLGVFGAWHNRVVSVFMLPMGLIRFGGQIG